MTDSVLARAQFGDSDAFAELTDPCRPQLRVAANLSAATGLARLDGNPGAGGVRHRYAASDVGWNEGRA